MFANSLLVVLLHLVGAALAMPSSPVSGLQKRSVTCLKVGDVATAKWVNSKEQTCTWEGTVGHNYGRNRGGEGGEYSCNGRCGMGCTGKAIGDAYTQRCFSHDICSYFENSHRGPLCPNCGRAWIEAADDFFTGHFVHGCGQENPSIQPRAPTGRPHCEFVRKSKEPKDYSTEQYLESAYSANEMWPPHL